MLPALTAIVTPVPEVTVRASYTETVARQTFKELTPILQQEFLGGPIFIGNPELEMSQLRNYDLRVDYTPYEGGLVSASIFRKDIEDPIEYVQRLASFNFTTARNYPRGRLTGFEFETRQDLGYFLDDLEGLKVGANATFLNTRVDLPADERAGFQLPSIQAPIKSRDMTSAPDSIYNLSLTYDIPTTGTKLGLFYTLTGDTLLAGAGEADGNFVPSVYAKEFDNLNFTASQAIGEYLNLKFQAKNLTNPSIDTVYRSRYIGRDVKNTSFTRGIDFSLSITFQVKF